jgi:hypothetical protein
METFVVRLWVPADAVDAASSSGSELHGTARHVASGRQTTFRSGAELLAILADLRPPLAAPGAPVPATTSHDGSNR